MWYRALEVARYIITKCSGMGLPVSNLKLQKMLYFLWVDYYKKTGRRLFADEICAWKLGPVVPEVYYEYCQYAGMPINMCYVSEIDKEDESILDELILKYVGVPASELVSRTHASGTAWDYIFENGKGNRKPIPFDLIINKEMN